MFKSPYTRLRQGFGGQARLNLVFILHLALFVLVVTGILPRAIIPYWTVLLIAYLLMVPLEEATLFFVRSIPLFIAIPAVWKYHADNLNMWRLASLAIFAKWFLLAKPWQIPRNFKIKEHGVHMIFHALTLFAVLSVFVAPDKHLAIKRIIYFINLGLIGAVVNYLIAARPEFQKRVIRNLAIPTILVTVAGFIQLLTTYLMDIFQFVDYWTFTIEKNLFGTGWASIALKANTWFAYFGDQLSLRMFSIFPDSHSFPIFILLGLPAVFAISIAHIVEKNGGVKAMSRTRGKLLVLFVPLIYLAAILTGTRGIWAASIGVIMFAMGLAWYMKRKAVSSGHRSAFKYICLYLVLFFMLFAPAYLIIASPQFLVSKSNSALLKKRIRSIIDIAETSNKERLRIWGLSLVSIKNHPLLGVGIGNFPVVLNQDLSLARAGSSAHNLYLHVGAEMGLGALIVFLYLLWLILRKSYRNFVDSDNSLTTVYFGAALLSMVWVLLYSLTDVALFDERAFLMFVVVVALTL